MRWASFSTSASRAACRGQSVTIFSRCVHNLPSSMLPLLPVQVVVRVAVLQERPPMDPRTPPPLAQLIQRCWAQDARARPSCAEVARIAELLMAHATFD